MAKKVMIVLLACSILFLGFTVGRFTNVLPLGAKMSQAAKENEEFKSLDDTQKAIALAIAAASPTIAKEVVSNLKKGGNLPKEAFNNIMTLARGVGAGQQPMQKPQQPGTSLEDILKDVKEVSVTPNAFTKGNKNAPIKMVVFTELLCPFCGRVDPTIQELQKEYGEDKIQLVFQGKLIHGEKAAFYHRAAFAAGKQGKFWEFADDMFKTQAEWSKTDPAEGFEKVIAPKAKALGLNVAKLKKDMESPEIKKMVEDEDANGAKMGVQGTPTVFINGRMVRGARDKDFFKSVIDALLKN